MTQTEKQFFTNAVEQSGSINASGFARKIGVSPASITLWKNGQSYPSDKTMLRIAMLCDLDPVEALALLNLWRCDDEAKSTYERLLHVAQSTALRCFPYIGALILASNANFGNLRENNDLDAPARAEISHKTSLFHHYAIFNETFLRLFSHMARHFRRTCILACILHT